MQLRIKICKSLKSLKRTHQKHIEHERDEIHHINLSPVCLVPLTCLAEPNYINYESMYRTA